MVWYKLQMLVILVILLHYCYIFIVFFYFFLILAKLFDMFSMYIFKIVFNLRMYKAIQPRPQRSYYCDNSDI